MIDELRRIHQAPGPLGWLRRHLLRAWARILEWASGLDVDSRLNLHQVTRNLWVGGHVPPRDYQRLAALGITCVIDLRAEWCDDPAGLGAHGIELLHVPAPDRFAPTAEALAEAVHWAMARLNRGGVLYCHCQHGVGRGPLMATAVLVGSGSSANDAYARVRGARWQAALNDRQLESLAAFVKLWEEPTRQADEPMFANVTASAGGLNGR